MGKLKGALARAINNKNLIIQNQAADKRKQEIETAKKAKKSKQNLKKPNGPTPPPFDKLDRLLLIGEGDFSFANSVVENQLCENVVASGFDSEQEVLEKYPSTALDNLKSLRKYDTEQCELMFNVDATNISATKDLKGQKFDCIMFNFPHIGNSIRDQARNIAQHQKLVSAYFESCSKHLKQDGKVVLILFEGEPYISWGIKRLGRDKNYTVVKSYQLNLETFPGYHHKLTSREGKTAKEQSSRPARVYVFVKKATE